MKKVLIFSLAYYPYVGGAEVAWKEITDRIDDIEFDMIVAKLDNNLANFERIGNINVYRIGFGNKIIDKLLYCFFSPIKAYFLNKEKKYIAYIGLMASYGGLASVFYKFINKKTPYILNLQDGDTDDYIAQKTKFIKGFYKKIFYKADIVTVLASFLGKRAIDNGFKGDIKLIPNGVDVDKFLNYTKDEKVILSLKSKLGLQELDKIIITTSRLNYKNAIDDIILSLKYLPDNYKFVCLGEGEERMNLEKLVKDNNLQNRVFLLGYVDHKEILDYLSIADFFCRPSLQEGLGNSFLEAMAFDLPVVATPVGGIVDFLIDGETGYFCQVKNPESIAKSITKFEEDQNKTEKILENAKKMVIDKYNWHKIAKTYQELFNEIK